MKNKHIIVIFLVQLLLVRGLANAQSPNAIPYQGVARNSAGNILASQPISLRISIHDVIPTGTVVYSETHAVTTTALGLFSVNIGQGTIISGTLAGVNWGTGAKFRQIELDTAPPSSYIDLGTTQFNSVPYALYAGSFQSGTAAGQMLYWDGSAWVTIPPGVVGQELTYGNNGPVWLTTNTVSITTAPVSNILGTSATGGGNIISSSIPVTARGICWSTSPNPTTSNSFTTNGTGFGSFVSNLTGLTIFTTYYVRAFATTSAGTVYGNEIIFTTLNTTFPTLATFPISNITRATAISGGFISNDGGETIIARGVCWGTSPNPTTANGFTADGTGTGTFASNLAGLTANTTYYVRAYATNSAALTGYGNEISFTTLNTTVPSLTTSPINYSTAVSGEYITDGGGNITDDGGTSVTARGVCWSTLPNPTTANSFTTDGTGTGIFVSNLIGLTPGTTYYLRAYASNSMGTAYGNEISFTTLNTTVPTLTTSPINSNTAVSGGIITNGGGSPVTARGVCWSTLPNPTTANSFTTDGTGTGTFVSNLTGLILGTTYYLRAYATNSLGTAYGNEISFTTFTIAIGQPYQGGILAYVLQPGDFGHDPNVPHGLIAAPSDQSTGVEWGCYGTTISGADGTAVGTGNQNTIDIMAGCATAGIAASLCGDLTLGGYSDWYLPSKAELNLLYLNRVAIGGFAVYLYWSSTEVDLYYAWFQYFNANGTQSYDIKNGNYIKVRAVRSF